MKKIFIVLTLVILVSCATDTTINYKEGDLSKTEKGKRSAKRSKSPYFDRLTSLK